MAVANSAIAYLQRALLAPALTALGGGGWEACFEHVLLPLLSEPPRRADAAARADTVMCKVFLQHLQALSARASFGALWARVLRVQRSLLTAPQEPLREAALESLKNMLLVMHSVRIFNTGDNYNDLWYITWEIIGEFLPNLKEELFPGVNDNTRPTANLPSHMQAHLPSNLPTLIPVGPSTPTILPVPNVPNLPKAGQTPIHSPNILVAPMANSPVNLIQTPPSLIAPTPISATALSAVPNTDPTLIPTPPAPNPTPVSGMVPIRNPLYDQSGLTSSVLLQPLNEMISTPIGISLQTQPPVLYQQPTLPSSKPDTSQNEPKHQAIESSPQNEPNTNLIKDAQQSELYAEYLSNPYNDAKEVTPKEATLYDPEDNRLVAGSKDQSVGEPEPLEIHPMLTQKSFSAHATPMHSKNKTQFGSTENVRPDSGIFNFSSYFGGGNDLVFPGSEVFDTLVSTHEG